MGIRAYKPTSPGARGMTVSDFSEITKTTPEKRLLTVRNRKGGRNNLGRITTRHHGGGAKRKYRIIDFKRDKDNIPAKVIAIEYDPNRSARLALLRYSDGEVRYILAPKGLVVGADIMNGPGAEIKLGNSLPIEKIPVGTIIHNVELNAGSGGQLCRSAGTFVQLMAKESGFAHLKLPSNEVRMVRLNCRATIGIIGNEEHENITIGKAGRSRHLGIRPTVRGVVMNPVDHPHGGGEGKSPQGNPHPVSPWGWHTKGKKTRNRKKGTSRLIIRRRK